jgi:death-on-curing family protein
LAITYLTVEEVLEIHYMLVAFFSHEPDPICPYGPKDINLLHSAIERPKTASGKKEKYTTLEAKGAALFHSLAKNHAFHNGNKRTALVSTVRFFDINGKRVIATDDELFDFVTAVAQDRMPNIPEEHSVDDLVQKISQWFNSHIVSIAHEARRMKTQEFLERCSQVGAKYRKNFSGNSWVVSTRTGGKHRSVTINISTTELPGRVIKKYLIILGLTEKFAGLSFDEFQRGLHPGQRIISELLSVLRRLAHA